MRARQFLAGRHVRLLDLHTGHGVLHKQCAVRFTDCGIFAGYLAGLINSERGICRNRIAVGRYGFPQGIGLTGLQLRDLVRLALFGIPFIDDLAVLVQDLDMRAGQFLAGRYVRLLNLDG
jgi:hypothetical protein